jgi:hypothetical protein
LMFDMPLVHGSGRSDFWRDDTDGIGNTKQYQEWNSKKRI